MTQGRNHSINKGRENNSMSAPSPSKSGNNSSDDGTSVEKVFDLIQQGKAQKGEGNHWEAAESFLEAYNLLTKLAANHKNYEKGNEDHDTSKNPPASAPSEENENEDDEHAKIAKLYQDQSHEYFHRTRESLIAAMEQEIKHDQDTEQANGSPRHLCFALEEDEISSRLRIFSTVFTKKMISTWMQEDQMQFKQQQDDDDDGDNSRALQKQMSLEERLMELNANLPKEFKSSGERIQDLNSGMKRLGLGMYTDDNKPNPLKVEAPRSAAQQVEDIIAQAKDEVALLKHDGGGDDDHDDSISDNAPFSDDDDDDSEAFLSDDVVELQNVAKIRNQVAAAQAKLAELVALLDTIPAAADEKEEAELQENGDAKGAGSSFDPAYGKKVLKDSRQSLHQALKLWKVKLR